MTDREIFDRIYSDDIEGFILLVDIYADLINSLVSDILYETNQKNTDECVADSFLAFYNNTDDVDLSRGSIRGYLGVIARRRAINLYFTLFPDADEVFDEYSVEEMSDMLENEELRENSELSDKIIRLCLREIAPGTTKENSADEAEEYPEEAEEYHYETAEEIVCECEKTDEPWEKPEEEQSDEIIKKKSSGFGRMLKTLVSMICLVAVVAAAVIAFDKLGTSQEAMTTTKVTVQATTTQEPFNPLLSAITAGNEKLIEELIANSLLLTDDVLRFAIESADKISYDSIRRIAEEVKNKYGSTGLEPILDSAIFGDFSSVEEKLKNKDESEMTPAEKLAKFFAETVGGQIG